MSRPAQLEQQIERVKQLQEEMLQENNGGTEPVDSNEPSAPLEVVPPQPQVQEPATISKEEYDKLEQRYRTLQGMHKADVAHLRGELQASTAAIQNLENRIIEAERAKMTPSAPAKYITQEDEDEYGDTLEMVRRAAKEEAENILGKREEGYLARIAELEAQVGHVRNIVPVVEDMTRSQAQQVKADFWTAIDTQVPNWREINDNMDFKAWLTAEDPITGSNRQQFLAQAQNEYNAPRVIKFFKEWERTAAGGQTPAPRTNTQDQLQKYVAPGTSRAAPPVDATKKTWSRAEISQFFQDSLQGKYANKPELKKQLEDDIFRAQAEGRVKS